MRNSDGMTINLRRHTQLYKSNQTNKRVSFVIQPKRQVFASNLTYCLFRLHFKRNPGHRMLFARILPQTQSGMTHTVWAWTSIKWNNVVCLGVPFEIQPKKLYCIAYTSKPTRKIAFSAELQTKPFIWISVSTCMCGFRTWRMSADARTSGELAMIPS